MPLLTHEFLRRDRDRIMDEWERAVRDDPQPVSLGKSALRDELPEFLDELASWMEGPDDPSVGMLHAVSAGHVAQRLKHAYELKQLIEEYRILRATILRLLLQEESVAAASGEDGREARVKELARLNAGLDRAISDAVEHFVAEREHIRERFIGVLGHDLRTPLGNILASADYMLRSGQLPPGLDRAAGRVARNAERMARMVRDLLDLTRGRIGGGIPITRSHTNLADVCRTIIEEMSITNPTRTLTFDAIRDFWGEWDHDRALQAVGNVVANALAYGTDPVTVTVHREGDVVVVAVMNRGDPIPEDRVQRLFDPFQRGDADGVRGHGVGLGLYIVSEIMRAHGGSVAVESSEGRGTTFTLRWPRESDMSQRSNDG
jgi:signal transduction histidine kinase